MTTVAPVAVPRRGLVLDLRAIKIVVQRDLIRTLQDSTRFVGRPQAVPQGGVRESSA